MIYLYDEELHRTELRKWIPLLSAQRIAKMRQYKFEKEQHTCVLAFLLLRYGLLMEYGITIMPYLHQEDRRCKPILTNIGLAFNFSHCNQAVACALDAESVGVDVQDASEELWRTKEQLLTHQELIQANDVMQVTRFWTLKEAYGKFRGYGMDYAFEKKDFSMIQSQRKWQRYQNLWAFSVEKKKYAASAFSMRPLDMQWITKEDFIKGLNLILESGEIT